jgi:hypothetical protein
VTNALDAVVELTMNTSTRNANKGSHGQVDTLREFGVTVGAFLVGRVSLQLSHLIVGRFLRLSSVSCIWLAAVGG